MPELAGAPAAGAEAEVDGAAAAAEVEAVDVAGLLNRLGAAA